MQRIFLKRGDSSDKKGLFTRRVLLCLTVLTFCSAIGTRPAVVHAAAGISHTDVSFTGDGGVTLKGTIVSPASTQRNPGLVLVHGSGTGLRKGYMPEAEAFAREGIVTLVYDKRTDGYSVAQRDYAQLAKDAVAAVHLLQKQTNVDPARVGLWGFSEGGYVAPLAAVNAKDVAFLVTVGAPGMSPSQQTVWSARNYFVHAGATGSVVDTFSPNLFRLLVGAGQFAEAYYDPKPVLSHITQPVLALWGADEQTVPPQESAQIFRHVFTLSGNIQLTTKFFEKADHKLHRTDDGGFTRLDAIAPGYAAFTANWIKTLAGSQQVGTADPVPAQLSQSVPLRPLAWYQSSTLLVVAFALLLVLFVASRVIVFVSRRLRGRKEANAAMRPARWLAYIGIASVGGLLLYVAFNIVTASEIVGPIILGRPLPWLLLQLLSVGVPIAAFCTGLACWSARRQLQRAELACLACLILAVIVFVPFAMFWGLLTLL